MRELFADTSGFAHYFVHTEPFHETARGLFLRADSGDVQIVTTNYVLLEFVSLLISPLGISGTLRSEILRAIRMTPWIEIVQVDRTLDELGWALLEDRPDKDWSLADCVSFVIMKSRRISEAITSDHHFEQAGFVRLLR